MGLGRGIPARVYAGDKWLWDWVAGFQPAFTQVTSGYGIGSLDRLCKKEIKKIEKKVLKMHIIY
jgi:hypothetical protein